MALKGNPRLEVKRAKFSNIERGHVLQAARAPVILDERQALAVTARIELDLRTGSSFTRMQTLALGPLVASVEELKVISYGSCQFPTLGFVVDRYFRVKNFVSEPFWLIRVTHQKEGIKVNFSWRRVHLFDRMSVVVVYERCLTARLAKVIKMQRKPTSKWRPLPLTTVELQKMGSRYLRMDSQSVMKIAEDLYTKGWISYPRTETDQFDKDMDLRKLVEKQTQDSNWGEYAQGLLDGRFKWPRPGRNNDKAHPPIHPVNYVARTQLDDRERRVYEFVVRRFLAACSEDAKGESTTVEIEYGSEFFHANGLIVLERNYLDVYPYDKWESSQSLPPFTVDETFEPTEAKLEHGKTSPPGYLTEPELIALMDANGIGTDATMAEHIAKIKDRKYVMAVPRSGRASGNGDGETDEDDVQARRGGRGRARGGRGGRGGRGARTERPSRGGAQGMEELLPTTLGTALIEGYGNMGFATDLSKPFLRKEVRITEMQRNPNHLVADDATDGAQNESDLCRHGHEERRRAREPGALQGHVHPHDTAAARLEGCRFWSVWDRCRAVG